PPPKKKPRSRPTPPLLGDLDVDLGDLDVDLGDLGVDLGDLDADLSPPPPLGDLSGPGDSTGTRDLLPTLGRLAGERVGMVAPSDLAAFEVLNRADGPVEEGAGGTTAILSEAGDKATAAAAVAAAEAGTALTFRGTTPAPAAAATAPAAAAFTAAVTSSLWAGESRVASGDSE
ncbi:unnamed protein product, partial [Ectocarpus sp. 12 AP-2014]